MMQFKDKWWLCEACDVRWHGPDPTCWNCDEETTNTTPFARPFLTSQYGFG